MTQREPDASGQTPDAGDEHEDGGGRGTNRPAAEDVGSAHEAQWQLSWGRRREVLESPRSRAALRTAQVLRRLATHLVTTVAGGDELTRWAVALEGLEEEVAPSGGRSRYDGYPATAQAVGASFVTHPVGGAANPVAVPMTMDVDTDAASVRGECCYGPLFEGTPGVLHGGFVAATFDQVLGAAAALGGEPAVTGTLTIRYVRPTPIDEPLVFEAEFRGRRGRKVDVVGRCLAGDVVTAEATAVFVTIQDDRFIPPA